MQTLGTIHNLFQISPSAPFLLSRFRNLVYIITPQCEKSVGLLDSVRFMTNAQSLYRLAGFIESKEYLKSVLDIKNKDL
jgi:hypothetical protein